jgi:hypothetical protein
VDSIVNKGATFSNGKITTLGNDWYRLSMTGNVPSAATSPPVPLITNNAYNSNDFYVFGAQIEEGSVATPYIKTQGTVPVLGNQDARKNLVPGASGFGVTGSTYSSAIPNMLSKRTATAYGTIVIPANKGNSSPVSAYIENGFNVKSVSAGGNSRYDVSFVRPMTNNTYCVILSGEYESTDYTAGVDEFALLSVRAGTGNKYKTTNGFRVEELRQYTVDNSWIEQSVRYQKGFTQRIHFMVFGGATYGQP